MKQQGRRSAAKAKGSKKKVPRKSAAKTRTKRRPATPLGPGEVPPRKKDVSKLRGRFGLGAAATQKELQLAEVVRVENGLTTAAREEVNPAQLRLRALRARGAAPTPGAAPGMPLLPIVPAMVNWTPLGPLAVPNGQTYGGARVLISGRVTAIATHPTKAARIFIGTSRGGIWRTDDAAQTWTPLSDHAESLAIGALAIAIDDPDVLYAGTGEGNVQYYSTAFPLNSAPGIYLGVGILKSTDGGATWVNHADALLANHSFYRIAVDPSDSNHAFAATSLGLCRTVDGVNWTVLSGGGLPAISASVIACTDVFVDSSD